MAYYSRRGPYTKARVRSLARQQGYYLASQAQANKFGSFAEIWVWGWDETGRRVVLCRFYACAGRPNGHCDYPPVSGNVFISGGVRANQLGLALDWSPVDE
jgi:hypothetical protein